MFKTRLLKEALVFSAGHFITFNGNICERLHGHNWRVQCEVCGDVDENGYVFDFIALRDTLAELVAALDHRMLLPANHPTITVSSEAGETTARFESRRWVFPADECVILPVANTTAELIAKWLAEQLVEKTSSEQWKHIETLQVDVEENFGQWGCYQMPIVSETTSTPEN